MRSKFGKKRKEYTQIAIITLLLLGTLGCSRLEYENKVLPLADRCIHNLPISEISKLTISRCHIEACREAAFVGGPKFSDADCISYMKQTRPNYPQAEDGVPAGQSPEEVAVKEYNERERKPASN